MVGQWYEPGQEYTVELTNKLPFVTFHDFLLWLSPKDLKVFKKQEEEKEENLTEGSTKVCVFCEFLVTERFIILYASASAECTLTQIK
ncbi:unnamed protein product [Dibothriocephalus latus]|uniref:Uncharacterized protein n=1 Tax=Dibothriocephalus latus TaxID=60516 RepID=A0A3P6QY90_DIBLA|nr:unnamed protein product [Dibothriocephalus latus]